MISYLLVTVIAAVSGGEGNVIVIILMRAMIMKMKEMPMINSACGGQLPY